jgi:ribosome-binding protein aMBF1 (putative translation factor)
MKKANKFAVGSGCYVCRCCGRKTRDVGGDGSSIGLCEQCYEVGGIENQIADGNYDGPGELALLQAEIAQLNEFVRSKGGKV